MPFDLQPLTSFSITLSGLTFFVTYSLMQIAWWVKPRLLQVLAPSGRIYYGGWWLVIGMLAGYSFSLSGPYFISVVIASGVILLWGSIDEQKKLSAAWQLLGQILAAGSVVAGGWYIPYITHPLQGGILNLSWYTFGGLVLPGSLIAVFWLVALMNAINFFDGSDGLAGSIAWVAFCTLAAVSLLPQTQDSTTLALALIGLGATTAFLLWNWFPARLYLGTVGSWFIALTLGLTAIAGGGKIATTILVLAIPLVDAGWVTLQRWWYGQPLGQGDRTRHIHFRLQAAGFTPPQIALLIAGISGVLGFLAVALQTKQKLISFLIVAVVLLGASAASLKFLNPSRSNNTV
jgi:UDP-GlcNAc:undecaprenyl-phosphate GlcNAc-1-phosphate transferase